MMFETERLLIKPIIDESAVDLNDVRAVFTKNVTRHLPGDWQNITSDEGLLGWIRGRIEECSLFALEYRQTGMLAGFLILYGVSEGGPEIRIGYLLSEKFWGQGIVSELIEGLVIKAEELGSIHVLTGGVIKENIASVKVLTKNGFTYSHSENGSDIYQYNFQLGSR